MLLRISVDRQFMVLIQANRELGLDCDGEVGEYDGREREREKGRG